MGLCSAPQAPCAGTGTRGESSVSITSWDSARRGPPVNSCSEYQAPCPRVSPGPIWALITGQRHDWVWGRVEGREGPPLL